MYRRLYQLRIGDNFGSESADQIKPVSQEKQRQSLNEFYKLGEIYRNTIIPFGGSTDPLERLGSNRITISDNHIKFEIEKVGGESTEGNVGEITIYNLADDSAKLIQRLSGIKNFIELTAGYEDEGLKTIFRGNLVAVEDVFDGMDRRTKLKVSDGGAFIQNQLSARKYPKGTLVDDIVDDLLGDLGLARGLIYRLGPRFVTKHQLIIHGPAAGELSRLLETFGYHLNVQDLFANIVSSKIETAVGSSEADITSPIQVPLIKRIINVTVDSGLVTTPTFMGDYSDLTTQEAQEQASTGIKFKSLLNGEFIPNEIVQVVSNTISGVYRILKVTHTGSYRGDEWFSEVEAEDVSLDDRLGGAAPISPPEADERGPRINFGNNVLPGEL